MIAAQKSQGGKTMANFTVISEIEGAVRTVPVSVFESATSYAWDEDREAVVVEDSYHGHIVLDAEDPNASGGIHFNSDGPLGWKVLDDDEEAARIFDGICEIVGTTDGEIDVAAYCESAFEPGMWKKVDADLQYRIASKVTEELAAHLEKRAEAAEEAVKGEFRCDGYEHVFNNAILSAARLSGRSQRDAYIGIGPTGSLESACDTYVFAGRPTVRVDRDGEMIGECDAFSNIASLAVGEPMVVTVEDGMFVIQAAEG
jgi:hypothetical protein